MRKRIWLMGLFLMGVLLLTLGATSVFAQEPVVSDGKAQEEMHQACKNGDYGAMAELHAQYHGGEGATTDGMMSGCGGADGTMGGGMMGNW